MLNNIILIDYEKGYANVVNAIKEDQWGKECISDIRDKTDAHTHIKLAKLDDEIVGEGYGKRVGDVFYLQEIIIKPQYQHNHIGSMFIDYFINYAKKLNLSNIVCECVLSNGRMNVESLMKKYNFKEIIKIKEYWGYVLPNAWCKQCGCRPCKCTNVIFIKDLN